MYIVALVDRVEIYQIPLLRGLRRAVVERDVGLLVVASHAMDPRSGQLMRELFQDGRTGVVVTGLTDLDTGGSRVPLDKIAQSTVPVVTVGLAAPGVPAIRPDNENAIRSAMDHIVACGRRRPLFVAGPPDNVDSDERMKAFVQAVADHGLEDSAVVHAGFDIELAYRAVTGLLTADTPWRFDAILAANDAMAVGAMDALQAHGLRVPHDVAVVGFDNTEGAQVSEPPLTSLDAQLVEQGEIAGTMLLDRMAGRDTPDGARVHAPLLVRGSSDPSAEGAPAGEDGDPGGDVAGADSAARSQLLLSNTVLEMHRSLSRCQTFADFTREIREYLKRLNVTRLFIVLLDEYIDLTAEVDETRERTGRVMLSFLGGELSAEPEPTAFSISEHLPEWHSQELSRGVLTMQTLFSADRWFGIMLYEQEPLDRHAGEALRIETSRLLDTVARAAELTRRAEELEALVTARTDELQREVVSRRDAQRKLQEMNQQLKRALVMDGLTGLHNRPSFDDHLAQSWHQHRRRGEPLTVLMIDVDHFKAYNDTYGHLSGDDCLRQVAQCLRTATVREQDIVARYGGEEFAIILPQTGVSGAVNVAERILEAFEERAMPHTGADSGRVSVSVGIGSTETLGVTSTDMLLDLADKALYEAKHQGRGRFVVLTGAAARPPDIPSFPDVVARGNSS